MLRYRVSAEVVLGATRGWLECGDGALLSMITAQDAIAVTLRRELAPIDGWLCRFLDPSWTPEGVGRRRSFSERELFALGWPDVDPVALERDEL